MNTKGQIIIIALVFMAIITVLSVGFVSYETFTIRQARTEYWQAQALNLAEAGINKAIFNLNQGGSYPGETTVLGPGVFAVNVTSIDSQTKIIEATGYIPNASQPLAQKRVRIKVTAEPATTSAAFHYAMQAGEGGVEMGDNTKVIGNLYVNGSIAGAGSTKSTVTGDAVAAATSTIEKVKVQGNAHGNIIKNSAVEGDAYYQTLINTTVSGTLHSGSPNPELRPFPVSDSQISDWKEAALAGGVISGDYRPPKDSIVFLGPKKITGNLNLTANQTLVLTGTLWVQGKINFYNNIIVRLDASYGDKSGLIISDGPIQIDNNVVFSGSGHPKSFLMLLTLSDCLGDDQGPDCAEKDAAVFIKNNAGSAVLYAKNGLIYLHNNVQAKELTGYKIKMNNNVEITYESGLTATEIISGPGGAWRFVKGTWQAD